MQFRLTILGSSSAIPVFDRMPTSQVLQVGEDLILIDCGEGTQVQLRRFGVRMQRIKYIFISHLHGDHFFGLVGLISTMNLLGRTRELSIYGDARLEGIIRTQMEVTETEIHYPLLFHPIDPETDGVIMDGARFIVEAFPLAHRIPTYGFIFREKERLRRVVAERLQDTEVPVEAWGRIRAGEDFVDASGRLYRNEDITLPAPPPRTYAFVSDTLYYPEIAPRVAGADLLYHEATFLHEMEEIAREKFHATALQAGMTARDAGVRKLIIGHFSARYKELTPLLEEARSIFPETYLGNEGTVFIVEPL